jgi:hypothetical protein
MGTSRIWSSSRGLLALVGDRFHNCSHEREHLANLQAWQAITSRHSTRRLCLHVPHCSCRSTLHSLGVQITHHLTMHMATALRNCSETHKYKL